ncbi:MAG: hypothetical protein RL682_1147 [Pseudomonadota bacterium]|jgi:hypothetical protein
MPATHLFIARILLGAWLSAFAALGMAATITGANSPVSSYILSDSVGYGLQLDGLEAKLQDALGGPSKINHDGARSITTPGSQTKKSGLQMVEADKALIAKAGVIIIILGMNQMEPSFEESQVQLMQLLKSIAPSARYFWVDIGATIAPQASGWSARNKVIYANASPLGYTVISRYRAIFGPGADPLNIQPGLNFPNWATEEGYGGPGNLHGYSGELSQAILAAVAATPARSVCAIHSPITSYVLGDSIAFGVYSETLADKLRATLHGPSRISYDVGRSIETPGLQIQKSALDSVALDRAYIAKSQVIVIILGTNQIEASFSDSQQQLMTKLRSVAPNAKYFWVDIGATVANQAPSWSARNRVIYDNAAALGYSVISRYKAIFGPLVDPLRITPGLNFPGMTTEPGFGAEGNVHGAYPELSRAILDAVSAWAISCER